MSESRTIEGTPSARTVAAGINLAGKVCVITGAASGLGRESARALAETGVRLVLAGRNRSALAETKAWLGAEVPGVEATTVQLDLTSLSSVRTAAAAIADQAPQIHLLMNNAGVMFTPFGRTSDGFEMQFGTNHLGHFELTRQLTSQLKAAGGARVVNLASDGHLICDVDLDDPNWHHREYDKFLAYGASKTANVQHVVELERRLSEYGVHAYAVHPGVVATALARHMTKRDFAALGDVKPAHQRESADSVTALSDVLTPQQGAATQVWAATSKQLEEVGGLYLAGCAVRADAAPYALDADRAAGLWDLSEQLCAG